VSPRRLPPVLGTLLAALIASACATDMTEPWEVKEPLLLGARVEVEGAPERPRPKLGERFAIRQFLGTPSPLGSPLAGRYDMDAALCLGFRSPSGDLTCVGEQELTPSVTVVSDTEVLMSGLALDVEALVRAIAEADLPTLPSTPGGGSAFDIPAALASLDRLALFGALCIEGRVERVPERSVRADPPSALFRCVDNAGVAFPAVSNFTLSVLLDRGRPFDANKNPSLACDPSAPDSPCNAGRALQGEPLVPGSFVIARPAPDDATPREVVAWLPTEAATAPTWEGCTADPNILQVRAGSEKHEVRVRFDPSDREPYQFEIAENGVQKVRDGRESVLLSHAISTRGGELERHFSQINGDRSDADAEIRFDYEPPEPSDDPDARIPPGGRLVRFYFTLRDERGGVDFATRELCLVASE
jgi:hypothetical protein